MRKILWAAVCCLMALSLVLAACGTSTPTTTTSAPPTTTSTSTTTAQPTSTPTATILPTQSPPVSSDKPQYGGTYTTTLNADPTSFDTGINPAGGGAFGGLVYEQFTGTDWTKGPAGTGQISPAGANGLEDYGPGVVDSWTMPKLGTFVMQVHQGVHWQLGTPATAAAAALMNGREVTVDDLINGFNRLMTSPRSWIRTGHLDVAIGTNMTKTGPWEITVLATADPTVTWQWIIQGSGFYAIYPQDIINKYGDIGDWHRAVGTGPYMISDYVPGSQQIFVKNPNYYQKNPIGPGKGDQLPYIDTYKALIIPDASTRQAAFRTGKLDAMGGVVLEDWKKFTKDNPKFQSVPYMSNSPYVIAMRQDKADLPFHDLRVRQALMYATDFNSIINDYYGGNAELDVNPVNRQVPLMYQPLTSMPADVQDLYKYNPDKAKQLLKDAGFPNGFKVSIAVSSSQSTGVDELSIYKSMWAKVGIDASIDVKEPATFSIWSGSAHDYPSMLYQVLFGSFSIQMTFSAARGLQLNNPSHINEPPGTIPIFEDIFKEYSKYVMADWPKAYEQYAKLKPLILAGAYYIPRPTPYVYNIWWPWLKNYYGMGGFIRYNWIDRDLKKSMGY